MASIFTWESDTPRVSSPWLQAVDDSTSVTPNADLASGEFFGDDNTAKRKIGNKITRLQAEPQEGPIEYKLHLLLRPRRRFKALSTSYTTPGNKRSVGSDDLDIVSEPTFATPSHPNTTQQTRQHRFQQLTTQLLWRLQQSSPHHSSSATNFIVPTLPDALAAHAQPSMQPGKLLHGLEESQGALYEIGVSDDGTFVGLAEDELQESLHNLRAMAGCLGCTIEVLRKQIVGHCEWIDEAAGPDRKVSNVKRGPLFVAEALIKPHLDTGDFSPRVNGQDVQSPSLDLPAKAAHQASEQLRVTLTGPTMCGKSTLLGTLTTSTLDSGRGTSRLSMLKHRHEITSGITSSVTQELFGYQDLPGGNVEVINYATENVASWIDIHAASAGSRLVFVSDSAGHPRYRRTTVRGLVGWAPHWTLFCVPANEAEDVPAAMTASTISDADLASAQLDLCLRLNLPLVVVLTKLDVATRASVRNSLSRVLDALKAAGRKPAMVPTAASKVFDGIVDSALVDQACDLVVPLLNNPVETVPVILTSAVEGTGISNLHALLHELPIPVPTETGALRTVFHVEDVYSKPAEVSGIIVSGHLQAGRIAVGDEMVLGPFSLHETTDDSDSEDLRRPSNAQLPHSRSFPGALHTKRASPVSIQHSLPGQEWKRWTVTSIRNLRLPSHALLAGQVGTIGIAPCDSTMSETIVNRIRKGMVLTHVPPSATKTFVAEFDRQDLETMAVGNHVVVYISSIRASAKVVSASVPDTLSDERDGDAAPFAFDDEIKDDQRPFLPVAGTVTAQRLYVTLSFDTGREFLMLHDKILVMPGSGPIVSLTGRKVVAGLDGFVGKIVELLG